MAEQRLFLSMVSDEFEKPGARYPGFRSALAAYLRRAGCHTEVQEDFRQEGAVDTVEKLAGYIRTCSAVVHLVGELAGAVADAAAVEAFLRAESDFLNDYPDLHAQLGDCSVLTYTQWEAFLALHYGVDLFVYATDTATSTQQQHLDRLKSVGRYAEPIRSDVDLLGKLIGDLKTIIPSIPELEQEIAKSRFLNHTAEDFLGRGAELEFLDSVWERRINVLSLIAWGGVGKTSVVCEWIQRRFIDRQWKDEDGSPALWRYFDWSFYDQGAGSLDDENATRTGNVGDFFEQALAFFGDPDPTRPGKGQRLAGLIRQQHALLILDGLEPLQQPPNHPQAGRLLDPDLADLLIALAQYNPGLCLVTSRQSVADIDGLHGRAAERRDLDELPKDVAVRLLRKLQIKGTDDELAAACEMFDCHALSLTLLGRFLFDAHGGDIARIDRVNLHKADRLTRPERHRTAWGVLEAYDGWLNTAQGDPNALAVLRLVGLFDRPATADCLTALRTPPVIPGLIESISTQAMDDDEWNILLRRLERAHLVKLRPSEKQPGALDIDAHPLVREYFAEQLSSMGTPARAPSPSADPDHASVTGKSTHPTNPSWIEAHSRLFDHLCTTTEHRPDTLPGLQPLYQAVTHGCLAGRHEEACDKVLYDRIWRRDFFSRDQLGAIGADLRAVAAFFDSPWQTLSPNLAEASQAWLLHEAALSLRALGRLTEAREPMRIVTEHLTDSKDWRNAAQAARNLSELEATLGLLDEAVSGGRRAIELADRSVDAFIRLMTRTTAAEAQQQCGDHEEARAQLDEAERIQAEWQPQFPLLYSLPGFRYTDLILAPAEHAVWRAVLNSKSQIPNTFQIENHKSLLAACTEAQRRATQTLEWAHRYGLGLLSIALDQLTLARAHLYRAVLEAESPADSALQPATTELNHVLRGLRQATSLDDLPKALLTAALLDAVRGEAFIPSALAHLAEAQQIAERGPMPLYLADIHLHRARICGMTKDQRESVEYDLREARRLIEKHKYGRRREELEDAEHFLA